MADGYGHLKEQVERRVSVVHSNLKPKRQRTRRSDVAKAFRLGIFHHFEAASYTQSILLVYYSLPLLQIYM